MSVHIKNLKRGFYTVVYANGEHRTIQVKQVKNGALAGQTIVGYMNGTSNTTDYEFFGTLQSGQIKFWRRFTSQPQNTAQRLFRIERALHIIDQNAEQYGKAYALKSGCCYVCNRLLTNPESITSGIGSECAKKSGV